ncbi:UNVERIFIED_CONTAM: hypothetical protein Scaly_0968400 [Sesamum calycinum]|uniref:Uncharacterized protein n=1 Tax=Sesamum calycinum TaxID=2727403 RepID=A0AAW2QYG4_9LAMI
MTTILAGHPPTRVPAVGESFSILHRWTDGRILCFGYTNQDSHVRTIVSGGPKRRRIRSSWALFSGKLDDGVEGDDDSGDDVKREDPQESGVSPVNSDILREKLEKIVGVDDSSFSGIDLATLIRNKYGRSYDVSVIKKEFMGRNLLALNVMWKYVEQVSKCFYRLIADYVISAYAGINHETSSMLEKVRPSVSSSSYVAQVFLPLTVALGVPFSTSLALCFCTVSVAVLTNLSFYIPLLLAGSFAPKTSRYSCLSILISFEQSCLMQERSFPLSEEEYILRLDDVANTLKCWGAVSHVRNSLEKLKERPRIGRTNASLGDYFGGTVGINRNLQTGHDLVHTNSFILACLLQAVSIFIDMDESGGRANEWIYK